MPRLNNIADLRVFEALARLGSLTAAGADLGIGVALASKRLQRLEGALGVRLVDRTTRAARLTVDGEALLPPCRAAIAAADAAEDAVAQDHGGLVRLAAAPAFAQRHIAPRLPAFLDAHPGLRVEIDASTQLVDLVDQGIDLAFRQMAPMPDLPTVRARFPDAHMLVASPDYLARHSAPDTPEDLGAHRLLTVGIPAPRLWSLTDGARRCEVPVRDALSGSDGEMAHAAALAGGGIALKSAWDVDADIAAGRLVHVLPRWHCGPRQVHVLVPMREFQPRRVTRLMEFLTAELRRRVPTGAG